MKQLSSIFESNTHVDISTFVYNTDLKISVTKIKTDNCKQYEALEKHVVNCLNEQLNNTGQTKFKAIWANDFYGSDRGHFKNLCFGDVVILNDKNKPVLFIDVKGVDGNSSNLGPISADSLYYFGYKYKTENLYNEYKNVDRIYLLLNRNGTEHKYIDPERLYNYITSDPQPLVEIYASDDRKKVAQLNGKINYKFINSPNNIRLYDQDIIISRWIKNSEHNKYFEL